MRPAVDKKTIHIRHKKIGIYRMEIYLLFMFLLVRTASSVFDQESHRACQQFTADTEIKNLIVEKQKLITPCPCVKQKIELDYSFGEIGDCYRQRMFENGVKQMCCYSPDGNIQIGAQQGGYMLFKTLWKNISDVQRSCCREESMCDMFYEINPSDDCSAYQPPVILTSSGDPTIQTIDGATFDFNGHGEYVFLETDDVEIQVRLGYVTPGNNDSTLFEAFSFFDKKTNETFEVHKSEKDIHVYKNGILMCDANRKGPFSPCEKPPPRPPNCMVQAGVGKAVIVGCGAKTFTQSIEFTAGELMSVRLTPNKYAKSVNISGLAGHQNNGSFLCRNGTEINVNSSETMIFDYGESWSLKDETESHFNYSLTNENYIFYNGHHTRPRFIEDLVGNLTQLFKGYTAKNISLFNETCRNYWDHKPNKQCLLTIARSKDYNLGLAVMTTVNDTRHKWEILHNKVPYFIKEMPNNIKAVYREDFNITIDLKKYVSDDQPDQLKYNIETKLSADEYTLAADGVFTWNVSTWLRYRDTSFTFQVKDRFNASGSHAVTVNYCGCDKPSECTFHTQNDNSTGNVVKAGCQCQEYFSGLYCEMELDPCTVGNFTCNQSCSKDNDRSSASWPCAPCPKGGLSIMVLNKQNCQNIDECDPGYSGEDKCEHHCNDTDGSFVCSCETGFMLNSNKYSCDDVDECAEQSHCKEHESCINNEGSYACDCAPGYTRNASDACAKISESSSSYVGSLAIIIVIKDADVDQINKTIDTPENRKTFINQLDERFQSAPGYKSVEVIKIIIIKTSANRARRRTNQVYKLSVEYIVHWSNESGAQINNDVQKSFSDYSNNSDITIEHLPDPIQFTNADVHVNNANETRLCNISSKNDCDSQSTDCHDDTGKINCTCKRGYNYVAVSTKFCKDSDECHDSNKARIPNCSGHGICSNTVGGYTCNCNEGFAKNASDPWNVTCEDIDECKSTGYACTGGICNNTIGGWDCACNSSGFIRQNVSTTTYLCTDIDECSNTSYHCGKGTCSNTVGNWSCTCPPGYKRNVIAPSNIQCEEINECTEFNNNSSIGERCVHGICVNTPGSWNCSCPANKVWQNVGNKSYPVYRCQGDYQYIGEIKLLWIDTTVRKGQLKDFLNETIESQFSRKDDLNISFEKGSPHMHDIFLNVEYLNATFDNRTSGYVQITALYILHLGESVIPGWIEQFQLNAFNKSNSFTSKDGNVVSIIGSSIFNESGENLCNIPNKTKCDLESTGCSVDNGSYSCVCKSGFHIRIDDHYCKDIDECKDKSVVCESGTCSNTVGSWECLCNATSSFSQINDSYGVCEDKNECDDTSYICKYGHCDDVIGGWNCTCNPGYNRQELMLNKIYTCTDEDECKTNVTCSNGGTCVNTEGNWTCKCPHGYEVRYINESYIDCRDEDECQTGVACSNGDTCQNIPGNWTCECPVGFDVLYINKSYIDCNDINECNRSDYSCEGDNNSSRCENLPGSWKCDCLKGYKAKKVSETARTCEDIDECADDRASCEGGECKNTVGGWYCECPDGYTNSSAENSGNYTICTDIDECVTTLKDISCLEASECVNTVGSWKCICSEGFTENVINKTSKTCEGDYQYVASVSFSLSGEIKDVSEIKIAIQKKIMAMYIEAFDDSSVWIEILKITGLPESTRRKRSIPQHEIKTEYVVHSTAEKTKDELNNVETVYRKDHSCDNETVKCDDKIGEFTIQFAKIQTKNNSAICETNKNDCDRTTTCVSTNGQLECNCTIKYPKRESRTSCIDPCQKSKCHETSTCSHGNNEDGYICGCGKGRKGDYCTEIDHEYKKQQTTLIAVGSSLGGLVLVLAGVIFGVCRWRAAKIKEAEKIAMRPIDSSGFKTFDNTFPSNQYMRNSRDDVDSLYSHRLPNVSIPRVEQNGHIPTSSYAKPIKLPKPHLRGSPHLLGSMPNLAYGAAEFYPSDYRRRSDQYPNRFSGDNNHALSASYNDLRNVNGRTSPLPDYDRSGSPKPDYRMDNRPSYDVTRPRSPRPDYNRRERLNASWDSGVGNGYSSDSNDFRRTDQRRGYPNEYRHSDTRF